MYTVTSASVLALDLSRHPSGAAVADVVDTALALEHVLTVGGPLVVDLDRAAARGRLLAVAERAPRLAAELGALPASLAGPGPLDLRPLQVALVGRLSDLVVLLQDELGGARALPQPVVDVVVDRAVAAWAGSSPDADPADLAALSAPWADLVGELPPAPPRSGDTGAVLDLLEAVAGTSAPAWAALDRAHDTHLRALAWSERMHAASRVAVEAGRTAEVARWQLSVVRATAASGHAAPGSTPGAVMSVVGAVQALALADLLDPAVGDALLRPCRSVGLVRS